MALLTAVGTCTFSPILSQSHWLKGTSSGSSPFVASSRSVSVSVSAPSKPIPGPYSLPLPFVLFLFSISQFGLWQWYVEEGIRRRREANATTIPGAMWDASSPIFSFLSFAFSHTHTQHSMAKWLNLINYCIVPIENQNSSQPLHRLLVW